VTPRLTAHHPRKECGCFVCEDTRGLLHNLERSGLDTLLHHAE
jgi:hypothetical protein